MKLVCVYYPRKDTEYIQFEKQILLKHTRLVDYVKVDDETLVVTFYFSDLKDDWMHFIKGKYSKMNTTTKSKILNFLIRKVVTMHMLKVICFRRNILKHMLKF